MKAKTATSKASKRTLAKKNAEAVKAARKAARMSKASTQTSGKPGKGKSLIGQSKKRK